MRTFLKNLGLAAIAASAAVWLLLPLKLLLELSWPEFVVAACVGAILGVAYNFAKKGGRRSVAFEVDTSRARSLQVSSATAPVVSAFIDAVSRHDGNAEYVLLAAEDVLLAALVRCEVQHRTPRRQTAGAVDCIAVYVTERLAAIPVQEEPK